MANYKSYIPPITGGFIRTYDFSDFDRFFFGKCSPNGSLLVIYHGRIRKKSPSPTCSSLKIDATGSRYDFPFEMVPFEFACSIFPGVSGLVF